jgi:hypothetical protein
MADDLATPETVAFYLGEMAGFRPLSLGPYGFCMAPEMTDDKGGSQE